MKHLFLTLLLAFASALCANAGGGKLILLIENGTYSSQNYIISEGEKVPSDFIREVWNADKRIISAKYTPMGWFAVASPGTGYDDQSYIYDTTKAVEDSIVLKEKRGVYVTSIGFGLMTGMGKSMWLTFFSSQQNITAQTHKLLSIKKIGEWAAQQREQGYQISHVAANATKWLVIMQKGTGISEQEVEVSNDYDSMIACVKQRWSEGWNVQTIDCSPDGKYLSIFCKYADGHSHQQRIGVCSTAQEAREFIKNNTGNGNFMTHVGGSYISTLLCNYDSPAERRNAIFGILGGLTSSVGDLATQIKENKQSNSDVSTSSDTATSTSGDCLSQGEYQTMYDKFAQTAEGICSSLANSSGSTSYYTGMKKNLRAAQREMKRLRSKASSCGYSLKKSKYETANP